MFVDFSGILFESLWSCALDTTKTTNYNTHKKTLHLSWRKCIAWIVKTQNNESFQFGFPISIDVISQLNKLFRLTNVWLDSNCKRSNSVNRNLLCFVHKLIWWLGSVAVMMFYIQIWRHISLYVYIFVVTMSVTDLNYLCVGFFCLKFLDPLFVCLYTSTMIHKRHFNFLFSFHFSMIS